MAHVKKKKKLIDAKNCNATEFCLEKNACNQKKRAGMNS
jgi:hypothetical protein